MHDSSVQHMLIYARTSLDLLIVTAIRAGMQFGEITTTLRSATCAATFALHALGRAVRFTRRLGTVDPMRVYWSALRELSIV